MNGTNVSDRMNSICSLTGIVVNGKGLGRTVGMPTANLEADKSEPLPEPGVYCTSAVIGGVSHIGVTNVGTKPTVDCSGEQSVETYFPGFSGDIYGKEITLEFHFKIRDIAKFDSLEALKRQVDADVRTCIQNGFPKLN